MLNLKLIINIILEKSFSSITKMVILQYKKEVILIMCNLFKIDVIMKFSI